MTFQIPDKEQPWLTRFFSDNNVLKWNQIENETASSKWLDQIKPWLQFLEDPDWTYPVILPLLEVDGSQQWYAMANSEQQYAKLVEELNSFIGPSYSDFIGQRVPISDKNVIESALKERFGNYVFRFGPDPNNSKSESEIESLLNLYHAVLKRRPPQPDRTQRPFGKIRGDFDRALLAGNEPGATRLMEELIATGRINAEQHKCLEIRKLAGLGYQRELALNRSLIQSVMELDLPPQTLVDLIDALYQMSVIPVEKESDFAKIIEPFKKQVFKSYSLLFRARKGIRQPNILRAFLLYELSQSTPNRIRCESILSDYPETTEGYAIAKGWFDGYQWEIQQTPSPSELPDPTVVLKTNANQAYLDEDYTLAIELCGKAIPEDWAIKLLLRSAENQGLEEVIRSVLTQLEPFTVQLGKLPGKDLQRWEKFRAQTQSTESSEQELETPIIKGWIDWVTWVNKGGYSKEPLSMLATEVARWSVDDYCHQPDTCQKLAQILGNATSQEGEIFREAFPYLVEFFVERLEKPKRVFLPLYSVLIKLLALCDSVSADELELASTLTQSLLEVGPSKNDYEECVSDLSELLSGNPSLYHINWALNMAEILAVSSSPSPERRLVFFTHVTSLIQTNLHRITETQRKVLKLLCQDYNCLEWFNGLTRTSEPVIGEETLNFRGLIGIYTLTTQAGLRAKQILESMLPNAVIELNEDHAASDRLKNLANKADIFVFAWKCSKHQAYFCVKEARSPRNLSMAAGKGSASIVQSVLQEI
ncbi:MAG: hypothetical protein HQM12_16080 [SAR324 cluster bacterium]|nr:hypothetical protein [SAR324 cluster bacterium]